MAKTVFTVTFNAEGGKASAPSMETNASGILAVLPTAERDGFTFTGWYTLPENGEKVTAATVFTTDTSVYAQWKAADVAKTSTIYLNGNGGTVERLSIFTYTVNAGTTLEALAFIPERTGYTFAGWYDAAENGKKLDGTQVLKDGETLYAYWIKKAVNNNTGSGTGGSSSGSFSGSSYTPPTGPDKTADTPVTGTWKQGDDGSYTFIKSNGTAAKDEWARINGRWYHFGTDGKMSTGWVPGKDGTWYHTSAVKGDTEGSMDTGWYLDPEGYWYYLDPATGSMKIGWVKSLYTGKWFYMNGSDKQASGTPNGAMLRNTVTPDGYTLNADGTWKEK